MRFSIMLGAAAATLWSGAAEAQSGTNSAALRRAVTVQNILGHQRQLDAIANSANETRASGTPGYRLSQQYVAAQLRGAGYRVRLQPFSFPFFQENGTPSFARVSPDPETFNPETDFATPTYSDAGTLNDAPLVPTNDVLIPPPATPGSTSGCEASDFLPPPAPNAIALIQRGTCDFGVKVANARAAGYAAAVLFNEGQPGRTDVSPVTLGVPQEIPAIFASFAVGSELYAQASAGEVLVDLSVDTTSELRVTRNVLAESPDGRANRVVVVGAHLDSVLEGPGINDNGSGSSTILEVALQMQQLGIRPLNKVRFAFWGAEELGLLGSEYYVENLSAAARGDIDVNLNFDMLGSTNFVRFVYDGDQSDFPPVPPGGLVAPPGSDIVERIFLQYFAARNLATAPTAFDGRSDYGPFIAQGIPAGGLFSGAEGIKTAAEATAFGGVAGVAYDRCYHEACDDIRNLSRQALNELGDAVAHSVLHFAQRSNPVRQAATTAAGARLSSSSGPLYKGDALQR